MITVRPLNGSFRNEDLDTSRAIDFYSCLAGLITRCQSKHDTHKHKIGWYLRMSEETLMLCLLCQSTLSDIWSYDGCGVIVSDGMSGRIECFYQQDDITAGQMVGFTTSPLPFTVEESVDVNA